MKTNRLLAAALIGAAVFAGFPPAAEAARQMMMLNMMKHLSQGGIAPDARDRVWKTVGALGPKEYSGWKAMAAKASKAQASGDAAAVKAACNACHDQYREQYKNKFGSNAGGGKGGDGAPVER